tara:strand:- start:590 stop:1330 length:741 start_codon:yes stop_codon:yes gene_type:complete
MQYQKINSMRQNLILIILLLFSFLNFSQGITSIYSFKVENPNDIQTIVLEMTKHFETDFAKAGTGTIEIVDEHFNGIEKSNLSFVYKFDDVQEMQDEYARANSSEEFRKINEIIVPLVKENSQTLLRSVTGGKGMGKTGVAMVFIMKVNNPTAYVNAYKELTEQMEENGKSKLFTEYGLSEVFSGGQQNPGATHHAVIGAIDMVSLVNGLDELFSSQEFRIFANKVAGNREILTQKTVFRLAVFNE